MIQWQAGQAVIVRNGPPRRKFGVPPGGPFDRISAARVAGEGDLFELTGAGRLQVGAEGFLWISGAARNGCFSVQAGEEVDFPFPTRGLRTYVRFSRQGEPAEWDAPPTLDTAELRYWPLRGGMDGEWLVSPRQDRRGVRLARREPPFRPPAVPDAPSEPCVPGVIQLPPDGNPIILGPDGPTVGGYPKLGVILDEDLDRVGQLAPGTILRFRPVI